MGQRRRPAPRFDQPDLPLHYPPDLELEPTHLHIDLYISIPARSAGGRVTNTVRARRDGSPTLVLNAVDFEDVSVRDLGGRTLAWQYDGKLLKITWSEPFAADESRQVEVAYRVVQPASGLYFCAPDATHPEMPLYAASDHETERARHWLPCVDLPNVRTSLDFLLRADEKLTILANGALVEEHNHGDGTKTAHWQLEQPCPSYLICVAVGDLVKADDGEFVDGERSIPVAYFTSADYSPDDLFRTFGRTKPMLAWMTELLARPFPYPKYYQFALLGIGGAMENISLVSWSDRFMQDAALAAEIGWFTDQVNVHEMAHSYFGDAVVCRDFAHAWLKESWATYIEQCWQEHVGGDDAAAYVNYQLAQEYFEEADDKYKRPIVTRRFRSSWDLYDRHLYQGGACRLHMLRRELGDATFWAAVRDYLARYEHQVVETDDFRHVLEEHSGRSLGRFFDQWFYASGYPDLKVSFEYDAARHEGTFVIEQKQVDKDKGIPAFQFTTDVAWIIGSEPSSRRVEVTEPRTVVVVAMPQAPDMVRFDPDRRVLHKLEFNPGDAMLRRQLVAAPDVIGRIQAARTLVDTSKRANVEDVVNAALQEPFWGVRIEIADALAAVNHTAAIAGLAGLLAVEQDGRVLVALLRAAGRYRDPELSTAVRRRLVAGLGPSATEAAYLALGAQREQAPFDLLAAAATRVTRDGRAQSGALRGLAATRREAAVKPLLTAAERGGSPNRVRPAAIAGLAEIGKGQERAQRERLAETLTDLLRDPWPPVQWAVAEALAVLAAPAAMPALEAFARPLSTQEQAHVERLVAALREEDKLDGSDLKKQVEELREKLRKLEEQVQTTAARLEAVPNRD
jgi:aminopeptidase N